MLGLGTDLPGLVPHCPENSLSSAVGPPSLSPGGFSSFRGHHLGETPNTPGVRKAAACWEVILAQVEMSCVCCKHFYTGVTVKEQQLLF